MRRKNFSVKISDKQKKSTKNKGEAAGDDTTTIATQWSKIYETTWHINDAMI